MAATDMRKAGLEIGARFYVPKQLGSLFAEGKTGIVNNILGDQELGMASIAVQYDNGVEALIARKWIARDYEEAQETRQKRFDRLVEVYPGDAGVPENMDTIERFVLVQSYETRVVRGTHSETMKVHKFEWGDTFDECVDFAGGEVLDGVMPEYVYDLDTGQQIELHVSSPIITKGEDQGIMINPLQPEEAAS